MKRIALAGTFALIFGLAVPAFAQDAPKQEEKPAESKPAEKPAAKPAAKPATHAESKPEERKPTESKPTDDRAESKPAPKPESKPAAKTADTRNATTHNDAEHRTTTRTTTQQTTKATTRNVSQTTTAHRIPDDKYRANFGREHTFHVGHPVQTGGRWRFNYGGYNFYYSQAWPAGWGYDDEVYVVDINGVYYLEDVAHPGVQLALVIDL